MKFRRLASYVLVVVVAVVLAEIFHPLAAIRTMAQGDCRTFPETGKTVCGRFLAYWEGNGGLAQQGYPISNTFVEVSELDGKSYTVQYFERAVFEEHPELAPPYDVLLSQLGTFQFQRKYPNGDPSPATPVAGTPAAGTPTPGASGEFEIYDPAVRIHGAYVTVLGAVRYNGAVPLINPEVTVALVDQAGNVIDSTPCCTLTTLVVPGGLIPYRHELLDLAAEMADVQVTVNGEPATVADIEFYQSDWRVEDAEIVLPTDPRNYPLIRGTLVHGGPKQTESINVAVILWDKDDNILDVQNQVFTPTDRAEGATYPFEIQFPNAAPAAVGADGRHYDFVVQFDITPGQ